MQTISKQSKSLLVDIDKYIPDTSNPLAKAFKHKGSVFGFTAPYIVEDVLKLTQTTINNVDLLVDSEGFTYKVFTTRDVCPAFTKGYGRVKQGINLRNHLILQSDNLVILEQPKNGKSVMTLFKTINVVLDNKGIIQQEVTISKKNKLDQYYTKCDVAKYFSDIILERYDHAETLFVEPSAGTGSFSKCIEGIISYDIDPKFETCIKQDFLKVDYLSTNTVVIGNPPFGKNANLALKFMNKAMSFDVEAVCFILPRTFEKVLFENKIDLRYSCVYKEPVPKNSFILDGKEYDVPCVFQIWEKRQHKRTPIIVDENKYFTLSTKQEATHAIRRVGGRSGCILEGLDHSESSTYFVKMENSIAESLKVLYPYIKEMASRTAGVRSITLKELTYILDNY